MTTAFQRSAFQNNAFQIDSAVASATPGRIRRIGIPGQFRDAEDDAEKLARRIREGTVQEIQAPEAPEAESVYFREAAKLAAAIARFRADARASEGAIARLELAQDTAKAQRALLHAQQALVLARAQEAAMLEELEVMDVAFLATVAIRATLQ